MERGRANSRAPGKLARAIRTSRLILPWATIRPCVSSTDFTGDDSRDTNQKLTAIQGSVICRNCRRSGRSPRSGQRSTLPVRRLGSGPSGAWTQIMGTSGGGLPLRRLQWRARPGLHPCLQIARAATIGSPRERVSPCARGPKNEVSSTMRVRQNLRATQAPGKQPGGHGLESQGHDDASSRFHIDSV